MNSNVVLIIQVMSLVFIAIAIVATAYLLVKRKIALGKLVLPGLIYLNLFIFLLLRILVKADVISAVTLPITGYVNMNNWAVVIQFQLAVTAMLIMVIVALNGKLNGNER